MPKKLWTTIRDQSNLYHRESIPKRVEKIKKKQKERRLTRDERETKAQIRAHLRAEQPFETIEYLRLMGLLIARMLCPHKQKLTRHWAPAAEGAVPSGTFGRFLRLTRFHELIKTLPFPNHENPTARPDRW